MALRPFRGSRVASLVVWVCPAAAVTRETVAHSVKRCVTRSVMGGMLCENRQAVILRGARLSVVFGIVRMYAGETRHLYQQAFYKTMLVLCDEVLLTALDTLTPIVMAVMVLLATIVASMTPDITT
jgi:hypothetical protein